MCALTRKEVCSVGKGWRIEVKDVSVVRFQSSFFFSSFRELVGSLLPGWNINSSFSAHGRKEKQKKNSEVSL